MATKYEAKWLRIVGLEEHRSTTHSEIVGSSSIPSRH
jgi:hypothetical protein